MYLSVLSAPSYFHNGIRSWNTLRYIRCMSCADFQVAFLNGWFKAFDSCISPPQIHKTPTVKKEIPSPPAAASHSRAALALGSSDGEMWMDEYKEEMMTKEKVKNPSGWKCALCHERYQDREVYISHMAEQHGKVGTGT